MAFAEAIDAWGHVEARMYLLFNAVNTPTNYAKSSSILNSIVGLRDQMSVIRAASREHLRKHPDCFKETERVLDKIRRAGSLRNALIHGKWRVHHVWNDGTYSHSYLARVHSNTDPFGPFPLDKKQEQKMLGAYIFTKKEIEQTTRKFQFVAERIWQHQQKIIMGMLPKA